MKKEEIRYSRDILLKDPRFAGYQKDFLAAVLNKRPVDGHRKICRHPWQ